MTDLPAELLALIQAVREETTHDATCIGVYDLPGALPHECDCSWQARFEAELARRWVASLVAIKDVAHKAHEGADLMAWNHGARYTEADIEAQRLKENNAALAAA